MKENPSAPFREADYLLVELEGDLLISGGPTPGVHAATVRRADGQPYLPASALKGAIREQLSRLAGEDVARRWLGSEGLGSRGEAGAVERPGGGTSLFSVSDGELISGPAEPFEKGGAYAVRTQVAIDRRRRRALDQHLFLRDTLAARDGVRFLAELDTRRLDNEERKLLANVVKTVCSIGAGKSTGLGAVKLRLLSRTELEPLLAAAPADLAAPRAAPALPPGEDFELIFEARDPISIGTDRLTGNLRRTRDYLPAAALRGALLTAGIEALAGVNPPADRSTDPLFHRSFLDPETCVLFGDGRIEEGEKGLHRAPPLTLHTCKAKALEHGRVDTLLTAYLSGVAAGRRHFTAPDLRCPQCGERLAPWRRAGSSPAQRRVLTRLGMDRASGRGKKGQLFSLEVLERETRFRAELRGVGPEARELIEAALAADLRIGHGRGQGYGRLRATEARALAQPESLGTRLAHFDSTVRARLELLADQTGCPAVEIGSALTHVAVWLESEFLPSHPAGSPERALLEDLGLTGEAEIVAADLRLGVRGGWDALAHKPRARQPALLAGSVALLRTPLLLADLETKLTPLERRGAGTSRERGFGWIRFSDPVHDPSWQSDPLRIPRWTTP